MIVAKMMEHNSSRRGTQTCHTHQLIFTIVWFKPDHGESDIVKVEDFPLYRITCFSRDQVEIKK